MTTFSQQTNESNAWVEYIGLVLPFSGVIQNQAADVAVSIFVAASAPDDIGGIFVKSGESMPLQIPDGEKLYFVAVFDGTAVIRLG